MGPGYSSVVANAAGLASRFRTWGSSNESHRQDVVSDVGLWRISNASVNLNTKFSAVRAQGKLLIHPRVEQGPYHYYPSQRVQSASGIYAQSGDMVLVPPSKKRLTVPRAIYVGTRAPHNWGHWLMNFLPGVMIADKFFGQEDSPPLIVPSGYAEGNSRVALFEHFWGRREVIVLEPDVEFIVEDLYWFEQPVADSPRPTELKRAEPKSLNIEAMSRFRHEVLTFALDLDSEKEKTRDIFLARADGSRRGYGGDVIHREAESLGYEIIYPERLSISQQIAAFSEARRVVGPMGSAFANILFAGPGTKALIFARHYPDLVEDWWAPFADLAGVETFVIHREGRRDPWELDPREVHQFLKDF